MATIFRELSDHPSYNIFLSLKIDFSLANSEDSLQFAAFQVCKSTHLEVSSIQKG